VIRILDRYMLRELWPLFAMGTLLFAGIIFLFSPLKDALEIAQEAGISHGLMWKLLGLRSLGIITFVLPMGMLFGCALLCGRLASSGELIATCSAGLPLGRLMRWVFVFAALVGVGGILFHEHAVVPGLQRAREIERGLELGSKAGVREHVRFVEVDSNTGAVRFLVYAARMDVAQGSLEDVTVVAFPEAGQEDASERPGLVRAASAQHLGEGRWKLADVRLWASPSGDGQHLAEYTLNTGRRPESIDVGRKDLQGVSAPEIRRRIRDIQGAAAQNPNINKLDALLRMELWQRIAVPLTCIPFAILGLPLGARKQGGGISLALGLSVLVCFLYYTVLRYADTAGREGLLDPAVAAWLTPCLALALGLALLYRSQR